MAAEAEASREARAKVFSMAYLVFWMMIFDTLEGGLGIFDCIFGIFNGVFVHGIVYLVF